MYDISFLTLLIYFQHFVCARKTAVPWGVAVDKGEISISVNIQILYFYLEMHMI